MAPQPWLFQRQKTSKPNKEQMSAHSLLPTSEIDLRSGGIFLKKRASCHGLDRDDIRQRWRTSCYNTRSSINAVASPVISSLLKQSISSPRPGIQTLDYVYYYFILKQNHHHSKKFKSMFHGGASLFALLSARSNRIQLSKLKQRGIITFIKKPGIFK